MNGRSRAAKLRRRMLVAGVGLAAVGVAVAHGRAADKATEKAADKATENATAEHDRVRTSRNGQSSRPRISPDVAGHRGGSGTPLLLLHGISLTWRVWKPVLPLLEAHHDVIAPTLLGHSGAARLADGVELSLAVLVDGVVAELDRLGLDKVHIAGNAMGGWIACELARRGRARSLVLFSPSGAFRSNLHSAALVAGLSTWLRLLGRHGQRAEKLAWTPRGRRLLASRLFEHPERADPLELVADIRAVKNSSVVLPLLKALGDTPLEPLPDPGCPVRVVWARRDRVIPYKHFGQPLLDRLPSAELVRLNGVGHVPMTDDPRAVARLITDVTSSVDRLHEPSTERGEA